MTLLFLNLLAMSGGTGAASPIAGPYSIEAKETFQGGAVAAETFVGGAAKAETYLGGSVEGQAY